MANCPVETLHCNVIYFSASVIIWNKQKFKNIKDENYCSWCHSVVADAMTLPWNGTVIFYAKNLQFILCSRT